MNTAQSEVTDRVAEVEGRSRKLFGWQLKLVGLIAFLWSVFQLWYASPLPFLFNFGVLIDLPARSVHLAFALVLCFFVYSPIKKLKNSKFGLIDWIFSGLSGLCCVYIFFFYAGLVDRNGILLEVPFTAWGQEFLFPFELLVGGLGIILLLEATRRAIGPPLVIVATCFLLYSYFGQSMPDLIAHQGLSFNRLVGYQWLGGEAIFGIPISVSVSFVFLFVLFGSLLDQAGGGKYFLSLAVALVGKFRGGPAKAAILASGLTGMISGSSIANVVTTGTFTIPVMKRTGFSAVKAGAIEVAASVNGQIMPPIMGAAAFIIAEMIGITYFDVITHAFIPALITFIALFFIAHIEAHKAGLKGMEKTEIPPLLETFLSGIHYLIPIFILVYLLLFLRWTPGSSVFYGILALMAIILLKNFNLRTKLTFSTFSIQLKAGFLEIFSGMIRGGMNMVTVAVAIASAGIIVGAVASSGLGNAMVEVVEIVSGGNIYILLLMVMALCLVLGLGLPTTANYLVVAALLANVMVEIGGAAGLVLPLIAVHLYVFYFGLMADVTPPVGLAAYAAAGISRADPIKTGVQAFWYEIRTAILPIVFIFNPELLLVGIKSFWHGLTVFIVSLLAILSFTAVTQQWLLVRLRWYETLLLLVAIVGLFRPDFLLDRFYPEFLEVSVDRFITKEQKIGEKQTFRIHVTRETDYGDRFKLFRFSGDENFSSKGLGVEIKKIKNNRYQVNEVKFNSQAEKAGIKSLQDFVTKIEVEQLVRPAKEWVYPIALFILSFTVFLQLKRRPAKAQLGSHF